MESSLYLFPLSFFSFYSWKGENRPRTERLGPVSLCGRLPSFTEFYQVFFLFFLLDTKRLGGMATLDGVVCWWLPFFVGECCLVDRCGGHFARRGRRPDDPDWLAANQSGPVLVSSPMKRLIIRKSVQIMNGQRIFYAILVVSRRERAHTPAGPRSLIGRRGGGVSQSAVAIGACGSWARSIRA